MYFRVILVSLGMFCHISDCGSVVVRCYSPYSTTPKRFNSLFPSVCVRISGHFVSNVLFDANLKCLQSQVFKVASYANLTFQQAI